MFFNFAKFKALLRVRRDMTTFHKYSIRSMNSGRKKILKLKDVFVRGTNCSLLMNKCVLESRGLIPLEWALGHLFEWYKGENTYLVLKIEFLSVLQKRSSSLAVCNSRKIFPVSQMPFLVYIPTHFYNKYRQENFNHCSSSTVKLWKLFIMGDNHVIFNPVKTVYWTVFNLIHSKILPSSIFSPKWHLKTPIESRREIFFFTVHLFRWNIY